MTADSHIPIGSIFRNAAARKYGFTDEFWVEVCRLYEKALAEDPREFHQLRFTAFLADPNEDTPDIPRWYMNRAGRRALGEAVLPDYPNDW